MERYLLEDGSEIQTLPPDNADLARCFLLNISEEEQWEMPLGALDSHAHASVFFVHMDGAEICGAIRLVLGSAGERLPILDVWPELPLIDRQDVAELSVLALGHDTRGTARSFLPLSAEMWRYCVLHDVEELWAELEPRMLRVYPRFGWPFQAMGELRTYWGDLSYPCCMSVLAAGEQYRKRALESTSYRAAVLQAIRGTPYKDWLT